MALVDVAPTTWPVRGDVQRNETMPAALLDATGEQIAMIIKAPVTGTIENIHMFFTAATVNSDASTNIKLSLFTVDSTTGLPTTTLYDGTNGQWDQTGSGLITANAWKDFNLVSPGSGAVSCTKGDEIAVVLQLVTRGGSDLLYTPTADSNFLRVNWPYICLDVGGSGWTKITNLGCNFVIEFNSADPESFVPMPECGGFVQTTQSDALEKGIRFQAPANVRCSGFMLGPARDSSGNADVTYWLTADGEAPGTATRLASVVLDDDVNASPTNYSTWLYIRWDGSPVELTAGTWYKLTTKCGSGAHPQVLRSTLSAAALKACLGMTGTFYWVTDDGTGLDWDVSNTDTFAPIYPVFDQIDGGGGGVKLAGASGGLVG